MNQNLINGIAAHGFDVVSFFNKRPKMGKPAYSVTYNGGDFHFSSEENKKAFENAPEKFVPEYGGYCAIAMSEDKALDPNPKSWEVRDDKLYFFTRKLFGIIDAKRQWVKDPSGKRELADNAWKKMNA